MKLRFLAARAVTPDVVTAPLCGSPRPPSCSTRDAIAQRRASSAGCTKTGGPAPASAAAASGVGGGMRRRVYLRYAVYGRSRFVATPVRDRCAARRGHTSTRDSACSLHVALRLLPALESSRSGSHLQAEREAAGEAAGGRHRLAHETREASLAAESGRQQRVTTGCARTRACRGPFPGLRPSGAAPAVGPARPPHAARLGRHDVAHVQLAVVVDVEEPGARECGREWSARERPQLRRSPAHRPCARTSAYRTSYLITTTLLISSHCGAGKRNAFASAAAERQVHGSGRSCYPRLQSRERAGEEYSHQARSGLDRLGGPAREVRTRRARVLTCARVGRRSWRRSHEPRTREQNVPEADNRGKGRLAAEVSLRCARTRGV